MIEGWARRAAAVIVGFLSFGSSVRAETPIDFDRQIRPILSNNCFKCHGPDAEERQAELRFDLRDEALANAESGKPAIVPGKPGESTLVKRVFSRDRRFVMPPPKSSRTLSLAQQELLREWIAQGAKYQTHWSFTAPKRPVAPQVRNESWARNTIDRFILARLESQSLRPSPAADRVTLIRRLSLDLTGLPPTPAEVDAFVADRHPDAYEGLVDRLMASPHFGERLALDWLDAARFADTHGYHIDSGRDMTRWRDWVIDAFNRNLPFDRFTVEQLAGDLLPNATLQQQVASGFNRNHMINFEGGAIPEEYQTAYVIDRVNTTGTVWLGLTVGCAQCHDHKFDPITQKEYYQLYAFFNNVDEQGLDGRKGNAQPMLKVPSQEQSSRLAKLDGAIAAAERHLDVSAPDIDVAQSQWESKVAEGGPVSWTRLDPSEMRSAGGATLKEQDNGSILASGKNPAHDTYTIVAPTSLKTITALRLEALPHRSFAGRGPGRSVNGNIILTEVRVATDRPLKIRRAEADFSQNDYAIAGAIDGQPSTGWAIYPEVGKAHTALFAIDAPPSAEGSKPLTVTLDFQSEWERHQLGHFRLSVTGARNPLEADKVPASIAKLLAIPGSQRTAGQRAELRTYYRRNVSEELKPIRDDLAKLRRERDALDAAIPTTMVMHELAARRETFMLVRGQYDKHGEPVKPGVPASLPPLPAGVPANRLALARWLVDPGHPLMARVIANRYWQMIFGTGLVKTAEDFGSQGEVPSHRELLDWLAVRFSAGWDVKALVRLMVTSSTYRQSSLSTPEALAHDPEDRLLARAPRLRLSAELIRDQALAVSGLLDARIGGASVSPYQPPGLWEELASRLDGKNWTAQTYEQSRGRDLYRRTMYTFWKRTSPPPTLVTFDAPDRETCTVRRARTNTPLQALILLNDPTYVEAARKLAERMMTECGPALESRIVLAFRLATARRPSPQEIAELKRIYLEQRAAYQRDPNDALKLLAVGDSPRDERLDPAELAAWSVVASTILNLDETISKG